MDTFESPQTGSVYNLAEGQSQEAPAFVCWRRLEDGTYRVRVQARTEELRDRILEELKGRLPNAGWTTGTSGGNDHVSVVTLSKRGRDLAIEDAVGVLNDVLPEFEECEEDGMGGNSSYRYA